MADSPWTLHPILAAGDAIKPNLWYIIPTEESDQQQIGPRLGLTCINLADTIVFFGGATPAGLFNDTYHLDKASLVWSKRSYTQAPSIRYDHGAFYDSYQDGMAIIGGCVGDSNSDQLCLQRQGATAWELPIVGLSNQPSARTHHAIAYDNTNCYLFGGGGAGTEPVGDPAVYQYHFATGVWQRHNVPGGPCPRQGHGIVIIGTSLYVFGGMANQLTFDDMWRFDTAKHEWQQIAPVGDAKPSARSGHVFAAMGTQIMLFGGLSLSPPQPTALADVWTFDTVTERWQELNLDTAPIAARFDCAHCVVKVSDLARPRHATELEATPGAVAKDPIEDVTAQFGAVIDGVSGAIPSDGQEIEAKASEQSLEPTTQDTTKPDNAIRTSTKVEQAGDEDEEKLCVLVFGGMDLLGNVHSDCAVLQVEPRC
eukprot:m.54189 g.54189  ORF g.54189 m.54189 type:complete len:425 (+) comp13606_c0_seq1:209-1483(+)